MLLLEELIRPYSAVLKSKKSYNWLYAILPNQMNKLKGYTGAAVKANEIQNKKLCLLGMTKMGMEQNAPKNPKHKAEQAVMPSKSDTKRIPPITISGITW